VIAEHSASTASIRRPDDGEGRDGAGARPHSVAMVEAKANMRNLAHIAARMSSLTMPCIPPAARACWNARSALTRRRRVHRMWCWRGKAVSAGRTTRRPGRSDAFSEGQAAQHASRAEAGGQDVDVPQAVQHRQYGGVRTDGRRDGVDRVIQVVRLASQQDQIVGAGDLVPADPLGRPCGFPARPPG